MMVLNSDSAKVWSEETHMTTGAIAFDTLSSSNPKILDEVDAIILSHPHYDRLFLIPELYKEK